MVAGRDRSGCSPSVSRIAADVIQDERTGQPYFLARITMTADEIKRLNGLKLVPGMPVEAFIRTDERTMLSYLLKPLTDQARRHSASRDAAVSASVAARCERWIRKPGRASQGTGAAASAYASVASCGT
jgi:hypothetical protein